MGLATGLVLMITCFSGAILVYEKELQQLFHPHRYFTAPAALRLPLDSLKSIVEKNVAGAKVSAIKVFSDPERNTELSFVPKDKDRAAKLTEKRGGQLIAFVDPYTGNIADVYNHRESFFYWIMDVHRRMLGGDTGKLVVGICTLFFIFILITGIVLWWPRNKALLKQRLRFKYNAGFKRLNHDYHIVLGFYTSIFLFIFAFTGLAWSFEWFNKAIYTFTSSSMERVKPLQSTISNKHQTLSAEAALNAVASHVISPYYSISLPTDAEGAFAVTVLPKENAHESATDTWFVDRYSGRIAGVQKFAARNAGQRVRATFKPVHVASIYGNTSKIIGLIVCLLGTFFPLSGIIMWINRARKKRVRSLSGALQQRPFNEAVENALLK